MAIAAPLLGGFGGILVFKEIADFIQIGLVARQTGQRFSGSRAVRGGTASIEDGTFRFSTDGLNIALPLEDAAAAAGVAGVAGKGKVTEAARRQALYAEAWTQPRYQVGLEAGVFRLQTNPHKPLPGEAGYTESPGPNADGRRFDAETAFLLSEQGKAQRGAAAAAAEFELEQLRLTYAERIAAARTDVDRERLRQELVTQERELQSRAGLQRERLGAEAAAQERLFAQQRALQAQEQQFKTVEAAADRAWRERTQREASELADYRKNLAADLAVDRAARAAEKITDVLSSLRFRTFGMGVKPETIAGFAGRFA